MIPLSLDRTRSQQRATAKLKAATDVRSAQSLKTWLDGVPSGRELYVKTLPNGQQVVSSSKHSKLVPFDKRYGSHQAEQLLFSTLVLTLGFHHSRHDDPAVRKAAETLMKLGMPEPFEKSKPKNTRELREALQVLVDAEQNIPVRHEDAGMQIELDPSFDTVSEEEQQRVRDKMSTMLAPMKEHDAAPQTRRQLGSLLAPMGAHWTKLDSEMSE